MDILIDKKQLADRIKIMAEQLEQHTAKYDNGLPPVFVCVLNGAYKFFTDLVNTNDHRDFLNQWIIGLRFKTNK